MSTTVETEKVTLYRVTWPAAGETWAEQRIVVLGDVDKNQMYYRQPASGDVSYDQRHRLAARQAMRFYSRRSGETTRMSHAEARQRGIFETPDDAKRWVWEALQSLSWAKRGDRGYFCDRHNRPFLSVSDRWPENAIASLDDFSSAVNGLKVWTGE